MRARLDWNEPNRSAPGWDPTEWHRPIDSLEELQQGEHEGLVAVAPAALKFPEQLHWVFGPYEVGLTDDLEARVWVIYRDEQDRIWLVRSTDDYTEVADKQLLPWSPQGSRWPSLVFDTNGTLIEAVTFRPAGQNDDEIWIVEAGEQPIEIALGTRPVLYRDPDGDILCFYHRDGKIYYRARSQNYATEHLLPTVGNGEPILRAVRTWTRRLFVDDTEYIVYQPVAIYTVSEQPRIFRYVMAEAKWVLVVYPIETGTAHAASMSVAGFGSITWERMVLDDVTPADAAALSLAGVGSILWEGIQRTTTEPANAAALGISEVGGLMWTEIQKTTEEPADAAAFSLSEVATILWIEV